MTCEWRLVDAGYFRALGLPLLRGRLFGPQDLPGSPRVFVIGQQTARALYGEADPIGRRLRLENGTSGEVVGVVGDVRMRNLGEPPEMLHPTAQSPRGGDRGYARVGRRRGVSSINRL